MRSEESPIQMLDRADNLRLSVSPCIALKRKSALGQFMTPAAVARYMASLFPPSTEPSCSLLDAGAGIGALHAPFLIGGQQATGFRSARLSWMLMKSMTSYESTSAPISPAILPAFPYSTVYCLKTSSKLLRSKAWRHGGTPMRSSIRHTKRSPATRHIVMSAVF